MRRGVTDFAALILQFGFLLVLYSISRLAFYLFNFGYFAGVESAALGPMFFYGTRFDLAVLAYLNAPFLLCFFQPFPISNRKLYERILWWLFIVPNGFALFTNLADAAFFPFSAKRATFDVFYLVGTGNDFWIMFPRYLANHWHLVLLLIVQIFCLSFVYKKLAAAMIRWRTSRPYLIEYISTALVTIALIVISARGGLQFKAIFPVQAAQYASAQYASLVLNTPFTLWHSAIRRSLKAKNYFTEEELARHFSTYHAPAGGEFIRRNVVFIVLEGFSREYVGSLNGGKECCTPFFDTLIQKGLTFEKGYANGQSSITGLPSTVASLPSFTGGAFITSRYINNRFTGIGTLLSEKGYTTSFFHGGTNGTMAFDVFMKLVGFDHYYGRTEYNNDADYDGNWGIWDEEYLQYFAQSLLTMKQPFFATVFTLTSHEPYWIPERYKNTFPAGEPEHLHSLRYADFALRRFFETAQTMPWYHDTLFVLLADHTMGTSQTADRGRVESYSIPIVFFTPAGDLTGRYTKIFQQLDIMPTLLDILHYDKPYFSFGTSAFSPRPDRYAYSFSQGLFQIISEGMVLHFGEGQKVGLYNYENDRLLQANLLGRNLPEEQALETQLKAFIQSYSTALVENKMTIPENQPPPGDLQQTVKGAASKLVKGNSGL